MPFETKRQSARNTTLTFAAAFVLAATGCGAAGHRTVQSRQAAPASADTDGSAAAVSGPALAGSSRQARSTRPAPVDPLALPDELRITIVGAEKLSLVRTEIETEGRSRALVQLDGAISVTITNPSSSPVRLVHMNPTNLVFTRTSTGEIFSLLRPCSPALQTDLLALADLPDDEGGLAGLAERPPRNNQAFRRRSIPARGVARRSDTPGILASRALRAGRLDAGTRSGYFAADAKSEAHDTGMRPRADEDLSLIHI